MRNSTVDILKAICAMLVVLLHVETPLAHYYQPLMRCAVPCFFMISGYMLADGNIYERLQRNIKNVIYLIFWSSALFIGIKLCLKGFDFSSVVPTKQQFIYFICLNENPWGFHLWYLSAYLYTLIFAIIVEKYNLWKFAFFCVPLLLIGDLVLGKYSILLLHQTYNFLYIRNFLFVGIPYFYLGAWLKRTKINDKKIRLNVLLGGGILFSITTIMENRFLIHYNLNAPRDHYISTTLLSVSIFLLALKHRSEKENFLSVVGRRDSAYIYILHPVLMTFWYGVSTKICIHNSFIMYGYRCLLPLFVFVSTLLFVLVFRYCKLKLGNIK